MIDEDLMIAKGMRNGKFNQHEKILLSITKHPE
jgi:hypothetical protein